MARIITPAADAMLDVEIPCLDHGFVRPVDYLGGDERVVQAARVSYGKGTKTVQEDKSLVGYLFRNAHTSPFEQVTLVFHIKLPLFVFAQMVRHRTAKLNAMSARYSVMPDEFYFPEADDVRVQSAINKQATTDALDATVGGEIVAVFEEEARDAYAKYEKLLEMGVAREQARMLLPQNLYTQIYWKIDLHNLFHFLGLRLDWHAQKEIRVYAVAMAKFAKAVAPLCYEAFEEYGLYGKRLSRSELAAVRAMIYGEAHTLTPKQDAELLQKLGMPFPPSPVTFESLVHDDERCKTDEKCNECRMVYDAQNACPGCGGSGHKDDYQYHG